MSKTFILANIHGQYYEKLCMQGMTSSHSHDLDLATAMIDLFGYQLLYNHDNQNL